jgi:hypothetical protein
MIPGLDPGEGKVYVLWSDDEVELGRWGGSRRRSVVATVGRRLCVGQELNGHGRTR